MSDEDAQRLELFKLAVEMADRASARRAGANSYFATLNTALAAAIGLLGSARRPPAQGSVPTFDAFGLAFAAFAGIALSLTWWALLRYYRRLNKAKFKVILDVEKRLPEQMFDDEWKALHPDEAAVSARPSRWQRARHREASTVEQVVPFVFAAIYVALAVRVYHR